jgi:hypothetical protein
MPRRPFAGAQTVSGNAQPIFGTTTTAVANPTYDKFAGNVTGANPSQTTLAVTSTLGFRNGDPILVCALYPVAGVPNVGWIVQILSATSMTVKGLTQAVASGAFVVLNTQAETVFIQAGFTNAGTLYLCTASTASATDPSLFSELSSGGFYSDPSTGNSHAYETVEYWAKGTASDTFIASYSQA